LIFGLNYIHINLCFPTLAENKCSDKWTLREVVTHACRFPVAFHSIDLDLTAKLET